MERAASFANKERLTDASLTKHSNGLLWQRCISNWIIIKKISEVLKNPPNWSPRWWNLNSTKLFWLSSIDVPTESKDRHLSLRKSASSCNRLATSVFIWRNDVKDIWNIWKSDWSLKEQATLRWCVDDNPGLGWFISETSWFSIFKPMA